MNYCFSCHHFPFGAINITLWFIFTPTLSTIPCQYSLLLPVPQESLLKWVWCGLRQWNFTGSSKPVEGTGGFCQRQNHSVAEQEFWKSPPRDPLVGIRCLCSCDVLQKDTFGLREAAIFQKSLDGNQPTNRKHYSSVASALLTNS